MRQVHRYEKETKSDLETPEDIVPELYQDGGVYSGALELISVQREWGNYESGRRALKDVTLYLCDVSVSSKMSHERTVFFL